MKDKEKQSLIDKWVNLLVHTDFYSAETQSTTDNSSVQDSTSTLLKMGSATLGAIALLSAAKKAKAATPSAIEQARKNIHWLKEADYDFVEAYRRMHSAQQLSETYIQMVLALPSEWSSFVQIPECAFNVAVRKDIDSNAYRENFHIPAEEQIFYVQDTSEAGTKNKGIVFTDVSVYIIQDINQPDNSISFDWKDIDYVTYKDEYLRFYFFSDTEETINEPEEPLLQIPLGYFAVGEYDANILGQDLARYFTIIGGSSPKEDYNVPQILFYDEIRRLQNKGAWDEALALTKQQIDSSDDPERYYYALVHILYVKAKDEYLNGGDCIATAMEAIPYAEKCMERYDNNIDTPNIWLHFAYLNYFIGKYQQAREVALLVTANGSAYNEEAVQSCQEKFPYFDEAFMQVQFPILSFQERKFLLVVDKYGNLWEEEHILVLSKELASKYLQFPAGHPRSNQLYIAHPRINNYYIPFEDYQKVMMEEEIREYCKLIRALGAAEITIECLNEEQGDNHQWVDSIRQSYEMHQPVQPIVSPYIPDDLFYHSYCWQQIAKLRMEGRLTSHKKVQHSLKWLEMDINADELEQIKAEIETQLTSAGIDFSEEEKNKYQLQDDIVLCIKTTFIPLDQLPPAEQPQAEN